MGGKKYAMQCKYTTTNKIQRKVPHFVHVRPKKPVGWTIHQVYNNNQNSNKRSRKEQHTTQIKQQTMEAMETFMLKKNHTQKRDLKKIY